ncbi:carbohydrate ABC transporter permease [Streptomyces chrestomyceticus]|uniref:carbohydrate ABC transporter permease n=1 Tax=Streptomyces chrestomyceticus TaxID=68185 RepID=UPI001FD52A1D|nr:sugar ABC transporter permease [Streptomyces chrestomyceticus]
MGRDGPVRGQGRTSAGGAGAGPEPGTGDRPTPGRDHRRGAGRERGHGHSHGHGTWFLILPALIPILVLSVGPLLYGIGLAFTDAQSGRTQATRWVGLLNFSDLLQDTLFWDSFRVGLVWALGVTVPQFFLALGLALLLGQELRLRWLARALAIIPWAMPEVVVGIMWRLVYHPDAGVLNETLRSVGLGPDEGRDWLSGTATALLAVIVVGVWAGMPQTTVTLLAGLQNVPRELHEAAAMDGAGAWRRFRTVTWPAIKPVALAVSALNFIWNFNSFALVFVLTDGGPGGRTRLPMLFAYEEAFRYGQFGYAAAMGLAMVALIAVLLAVYLSRRLRGEGEEEQ